MKFKVRIHLKENFADFEMDDLYDIKEFIQKWTKHAPKNKLKITIEGYDC